MHYSFQWRAVTLLAAVLTSSCATPTQRIDREAQRAGLSRSLVQGTAFRHLVYTRAQARGDTLTVFLEGDGLPWIAGRTPAADPTSRDPLGLNLLSQSPGAVMYVGRPCYHELHDPPCNVQAWTFARYSSETIDSMAAAIASQARERQIHTLQLVGYSGGGVLAVLIAERLENVSAVVTIGANLDTDAWSAHHGYLPLNASLNPARSTRPHPWQELHLQGVLDKSVPIATTRAYFERFPAAKRIAFEKYDHVCCWVRDWVSVQQRIREEME